MARTNWTASVAVLAGLPYAIVAVMPSQSSTGVTSAPKYSKEVLPIFRAHCFSCHKGAQAAAGLDLSSVAGIQKGGISGKLLVPGKPEASLLMNRVHGKGNRPQMPMGFAPLTAKQLATLTAWIKSGAKFDGGESRHWAYVPPTRPAVPKPVNSKWVRNPIDAFIVARLEKGALRPSPEASKETLARRASLDVVGLPPEPGMSDLPFEELVARLLDSPHYGERQAQVWLDLARYADSNGYEADHARTAWKYRDWVIAAFNANMPYDQFTIEQLGGDLIPGAQLDQLIATGFHRNTMLNLEGGVDPKEARYEMINDRVATTSQVWLGQTVQCARCHDHKYDPISQKDYFRMYAIFANTAFESRGDAKVGQEKYFEPSIPAPSPEQAQNKSKLELDLAGLRASLQSDSPEFEREVAEFVRAVKTSNIWEFHELSGDGLKATPDFILRAGDNSPANAVHKVRLHAPAGTRAIKLTVYPDAKLPSRGPGRASSGNFILSRATLTAGGQKLELEDPAASFVQGGYSLNGLFDDDPNSGWAIAPRMGEAHWLVLRLKEPLKADQEIILELGQESTAWPQHTIFQFSIQLSRMVERHLHTMPEAVSMATSRSPEPEKSPVVRDYVRSISASKLQVRNDLAKVESQLAELAKAIPMAMVMREVSNVKTLQTPFRPRGEFLQTGPMVVAGIPAAFGTTKASRVDRLALAKWIVDKRNPLTARVQVNRIWEQYFGRGLVETSENWGTPGSPPSHPELLDWLACELMDRDWDMKHIHRLILTSATYRQSSRATKSLLDRDPSNRLLARGPRYRLPAETIRDNALAIAGLLDPTIGGPSVFPHQPEGVWNTPYSGERWTTSKGANLYRRGLYTFWKRTATYPTFVNFDAPSREACTIRRERTNTPLQALNLMNDPAFLEAAKAFADRTARIGDARLRIEEMFGLCTARKPSKAELDRLLGLLRSLRSKYTEKPEEAQKLGGEVERSAWTMLASVLLNLDETITKE